MSRRGLGAMTSPVVAPARDPQRLYAVGYLGQPHLQRLCTLKDVLWPPGEGKQVFGGEALQQAPQNCSVAVRPGLGAHDIGPQRRYLVASTKRDVGLRRGPYKSVHDDGEELGDKLETGCDQLIFEAGPVSS